MVSGKLVKGRSTNNLSSSSASSAASAPLPRALALIALEDWESKVAGLESLADLALDARSSRMGAAATMHSAGPLRKPQSSPGVGGGDTLTDAVMLLHAVQAVTGECRNLRSQVSPSVCVSGAVLSVTALMGLQLSLLLHIKPTVVEKQWPYHRATK